MPYFDVFPFLFVGEPHISPSGKFSINLVSCLISFILATVSALFVWPLASPYMIALNTDQKTEINMLMKRYRRAEWINLTSNMKGVIGLCKMLLSLSEKYFTCLLMGRCIYSISVLGSCPSGWISLINTVTCSAIHIMTVGHGPRQDICA